MLATSFGASGADRCQGQTILWVLLDFSSHFILRTHPAPRIHASLDAGRGVGADRSATRASTSGPYLVSLPGPTPLMARSPWSSVGACSAISWSVASVKITKAGTLSC